MTVWPPPKPPLTDAILFWVYKLINLTMNTKFRNLCQINGCWVRYSTNKLINYLFIDSLFTCHGIFHHCCFLYYFWTPRRRVKTFHDVRRRDCIDFKVCTTHTTYKACIVFKNINMCVSNMCRPRQAYKDRRGRIFTDLQNHYAMAKGHRNLFSDLYAKDAYFVSPTFT